MMRDIEQWDESKRILVILAHPDDPEFFCGATIARWTSAGHSVGYVLLTRGDKGGSDPDLTHAALAAMREVEQRNAAACLGVRDVTLLSYPDGYLLPDLTVRREVVRAIRQAKPDIVVTCDPLNLFPSDNRINHPDHRAAGQVVVDAVFPAAGTRMFFPELLAEGLEPHSPRELWMSVTAAPNVTIDVTEFWPRKMDALRQHVSQIGDPAAFDERMKTRRTPESTEENPRYEEHFRRIVFQ
jgi:LmbE family N-acetylglucosaminyl deacetylase